MERKGQKGVLGRKWGALLWVCLWCLVCQTAPASAESKKEGDIPSGWQLAPRVGAALEFGGFAYNQYPYASMLRRQVEIDLLQYRRHIFYLVFDEKTMFGIPGDRWEFNLMKFDMVLGGYRYDWGDFYLGVFYHHRCNNNFLTRKYHLQTDRERGNIYDVGVEFLTKNMRLGMKNRGIPFDAPEDFEFLWRFGGGFWASKTVVDERINLDWIMRAQLRCDLFRYRNLIPYVEAAAEAFLGPDNRLAPSVEVGARLRLTPRVDLTPLVKWGREQLALTTSFVPPRYPFVAANYFYGGVRLETLIDAESFGPAAGRGSQLFPELHGQAGYAMFLGNEHFKGYGHIQLYLHALQWQDWTAFLDTNMTLNTRKEDFKPDKVSYAFRYGLTRYLDLFFVEGFAENAFRFDSNVFRRTTEQRNQAGIRFGTRGMKPGYVNYGIPLDGPETFAWLNNWQAQASVGHSFHNRDWQYGWQVNGQVRWDVLRWRFVIPYVQGEVNFLAGQGDTKDAWEGAVEPGLRLHGALDVALYYRFQHVKNNLVFQGANDNQSLLGIKVLF